MPLTNDFRRTGFALLFAASLGYGCNGKILDGETGSGGSSSTGTGGASSSGSGGSSSTGTGTGGASSTGTGGSSATGSGGSSGPGTGGASSSGSGGSPIITPDAGSSADAGGVTVKPTTFTPALAAPTCRKIKDLLVGMPCSDAEVSMVESSGPAGLQQLIINWETGATYQPMFEGKMLPFFRNLFQQVGFTATQDFKNQLLQNGGFDFGPFGTSAVGDDVYFKLVQNLQDSFALTAWQMVKEGTEPFSDVLTTTRFVMTTGLMSLYTQVEMPDDEPYNFSGGANTTTKLAWKLDYVDSIPLEDALNKNSPNYMTFDDGKPATMGSSFLFGGAGGFTTCQGVGTGSATVVNFGGASSGGFTNPTGGYAQLFQRLIGYTPRYPFVANPTCWEHPSKPYMTDSDVSDWRWVTIAPKQSSDSYVQPYDLPTLRGLSTVKLAMPRVGFYTTPAFLALWNTNDSNQHRVTMNQTLMASLGQSFTSDNNLTPLSEVGLASSHTTNTGECYGCHKSLDPMRMFFGNQYDFNDRNDFVANPFSGSQPNPRPAAPLQTAFAFADVNWASPSSGSTMANLGPLLLQATDQDTTDAGGPLPLFALSVAQQLCYWGNSNACSPSDAAFRSIVADFVSSGYNFPVLVKELFSSALLTGAAATSTYPADSSGDETVPISISRQAHFCAALSNRTGITDVCALQAAVPTSAQTTTATIAGSVAADAFSRGSQTPVTPAYPDLFYRAATEELCENVAKLVVDVTSSPYTSSSTSCSNGDGLLTKFVEQVMGINPGDPAHAQALSILQTHCAAAAKVKTTGGGSAQTNSVRSTFVLACESPTSLGIGL
ncbi:MAG TPA: hypothetical protein VH853_13385 [Polyangia bacterium]|jgi:hypothetical protein|nr:hypothetical protein [Polyangia bacterium]